MTTPTVASDNASASEYEPTFPRIVLMSTDGVAKEDAPINWGAGDPHPFKSNLKVVAMYLNAGVIEIYSSDGVREGMREIVPLSRVRVIREEMPLEVFVEELRHAELGYPDDDDDDVDDDPDDADPVSTAETPPAPAPNNGQVAP